MVFSKGSCEGAPTVCSGPRRGWYGHTKLTISNFFTGNTSSTSCLHWTRPIGRAISSSSSARPLRGQVSGYLGYRVLSGKAIREVL